MGTIWGQYGALSSLSVCLVVVIKTNIALNILISPDKLVEVFVREVFVRPLDLELLDMAEGRDENCFDCTAQGKKLSYVESSSQNGADEGWGIVNDHASKRPCVRAICVSVGLEETKAAIPEEDVGKQR